MRLDTDDGPPQVLLLLEAEPELAARFRLLTQRIDELNLEVSRRIDAERKLSDIVASLRRSVSVIRQLSEVDIAGSDFMHDACKVIYAVMQVRGLAIVSATQGRMEVRCTAGSLADMFRQTTQLDISLGHFQDLHHEPGDRWREALLAATSRICADPTAFDGAAVLPLSQSGELNGGLIVVGRPELHQSASVQLEWDLIAETLGSLISRAEIEARLIHAQKLQAIGQLTGGIAHDFNNILAVVMGNAELLLEEMGTLDMELAGEIHAAAARGATLTSRLLSFARKQPLQPEPTDVNVLLRGFDPMIRRTITENIDFELVSTGGLWQTQIDRSQLENAVLNLAVNARDAMPQGGKLTIETANTRLDHEYAARHSEIEPGQYVMIAVSDTGNGMSNDVIEEAFTPFFTTKEVGKGSGLGLSMVFGFVKQSLGHVKIYSEASLGTTVRMYFPRHFPKETVPQEDVGAGLKSAAIGKGRILLVEDDPGVLRFLMRSLVLSGFEVEGALTGEEGMDRLKQGGFDILLTDVVLGGEINGAQLAEVAEEMYPDLPVLFMSGYTENSIVHHGRLDPGVNFISKPFTRDQLVRRLNDILTRK
ncbi:Blue-light-activated protein [Sulfitobacter sp. THAF37]|uniref:ATP-binding protein n=1 Tax=Sulfitobacter sp. THAF37 TaxID=2587855 RepID=UPI001267C615|nr:ATP-binding protein [Sulfitobacter sp. THAF37]QFT57240.1 Blue-light-activated protein [Sulfitobacter sp. THAF37]